MTTDVLSPKGRLRPGAFLKYGLILIAIAFVLNLASLVGGVGLSVLAFVVGLILIWPWIAIWIKRLHDSGKSGWWLLLIVVVWLIVMTVASQVVTSMYAPADLQAEVQAASQAADVSAIINATMEVTRATALPNAVCSAIIALIIVLGGNLILRSDPGPNRFGPPPAA